MRLSGVLAGRERQAGAGQRAPPVQSSTPPDPFTRRDPDLRFGGRSGVCVSGAGGARRDPGGAATRGDGRPGGVRAALAGLAQLTRQRRRRGARGGGGVGCLRGRPAHLCQLLRRGPPGPEVRTPLPPPPPPPRCPGDRGRAGALGGGAVGPAAGPAPRAPPPPRAPPLPPSLSPG